MERKGARYKISSSRYAPTWEDSAAVGRLSSTSLPGGGVGDVTAVADIGHRSEYPRYQLESVHSRHAPGAHMASVQQTEPARGGGEEVNHFVAGPFRTRRRSEIAAEALTNRVERGRGAENYHRGSTHFTPDDLRYDG